MQSNSLFCKIQLSLHEIPNSIMISLFHLCLTMSSQNFLFVKSNYLETYYFAKSLVVDQKFKEFSICEQQCQTINSKNFLFAKSNYLETYYFAKSLVVDQKFKEFSICEIIIHQWQTIKSKNFLFAKSIVVDHKFKEFSICKIKLFKTRFYFLFCFTKNLWSTNDFAKQQVQKCLDFSKFMQK